MSKNGAAGKILSLEQLGAAAARARSAGRRVVQCHGVFDLLHVGHMRHFERARELGDLLVVTVTADRFVNKGPHRPTFNEGLRAEAIAALGCVDHVAINHAPNAIPAIKAVRPSVYVKGADYRSAKDDVTGGINKERAAVRAAGGTIRFTDDIVFSSSHLLNRHYSTLPTDVASWLSDFSRRHSSRDVIARFEQVRKLKVLTIGEAIIDEYRYCEAIGKSSKEPTLVVKSTSVEAFAGGILAVANNVAGFCDKVGVLTFVGAEAPHLGFIRSHLKSNVTPRFLYRKDAPTIVKSRYVESYHFTKLLEVYKINDALMADADRRALMRALEHEVPRHDLVVVVDYGHGMLNDEAVRLLCRKAKFLAVNAQANAGNIGYHTIGRYSRVDCACLAENELRLETRDRRGDLRKVLPAAAKRLGFKRMIVTRGKNGCMVYDSREGLREVPAFASVVQDRVGAGDAFLALAAPMAATGAPLEVVGFVGNVAGARAVATVGHRESLDKVALIKHVESLLK